MLFVCTQGSTNNSLCFIGPHRRYDPLNKLYIQLIPGMGHWGPDARPGDVRALTFATEHPPFHVNHSVLYSPSRFPLSLSCSQARWRRGEAVSMVSARESMMTYEQLR